MRNLAITVMSLILTTIVIGNAYYQKKQFYPSVVYITKSNPSMAIIYIQAFIIVIIIGKLMRRIFFGELRAVELEHLMERSWYAITETCLAFTVFRDDFNPKFLALFTLLLFLKAFHWLADERVDYMERSPVISWLFHIRIISLLIMLGILDVLFVCHAYQSTLNKGASVQLVFGFEYAILLTIVLNIVIKYAFHVNDFHELPWENKAVFLLYTELIMGFIKVILYFSFVIIMVRLYTLPLFAFRPMYYTVRAFKKAVNDVVMSRRAIRNMNTLYPDATAEELAAMDNVCIICREEMRSAAKKLPCNHIFHTSCLRSWFQRQQTCPTCRLNILRTPVSNGNGGGGGGPNGAQGGAVPAAGGGGGGAGAGAGGAAGINGGGAGNNGGGPNAGVTATAGGVITAAAGGLNGGGAAGGGGITTGGATGGNGGSGNGQPPFTGPLPDSSIAAGSNFYHAPPFAFPENIPLIPPFPYMAFNVPPPMPPPEGLSEEELRRLEQDTREGLEQRIRCLQSIQSMLDTSILMMQQYCAAVAAAANNYPTCAHGTSGDHSLCTQDVDTATTDTSAVLHHTTAETSGSGAESSDNELHHTSEESLGAASLPSPYNYSVKSSEWTVPEGSRSTQDEIGDFLPVSHSSSDRSVQPVPETQRSGSSSSTSSTTTEQEMLRQRRLEKFSKTN